MSFYRLSLVPLCGLLLLAACSPKKQEKPKGRPPAQVVVAPSSLADVPLQLTAVGTVESSESVAVRTQVSGELVKVAFREGDDVQRGALLFQLDPRTAQAALRRAEANLERNRVVAGNATRDYERYSQLAREGIITQEQAESYRTRAESAAADVAADRAAVDSAREQLGYCSIRSPIGGRLGVLAVHQGNVVKANETVLVTINRLTPVNVTFTVPEKNLAAIRLQMATGTVAVEVQTPGSDIREKGTLSFIDNTVDPATGTIRLKASFANAKKQLWPGQFVDVTLILATVKNAVVVPTQAVQTGQKGQFVFVVKGDGTAQLAPVTTGPAFQGKTMIEQGLGPNELVVVDGQMRVVPGSRVEVSGTGKGGNLEKADGPAAEPPKR